MRAYHHLVCNISQGGLRGLAPSFAPHYTIVIIQGSILLGNGSAVELAKLAAPWESLVFAMDCIFAVRVAPSVLVSNAGEKTISA